MMNSASILIFFIFAVAAINAKPKSVKNVSPTTTSLSSEERFRLYQKAKKEVDELNKKYPTAIFAINKFSFMSETERKKHLSPLPSVPKYSNNILFNDENITAPDSYNLKDEGKATPVKDQTLSNTVKCGSCFAFAATAAVESQYLIAKNQELDLSEEYLLECDTADAECEGGFEDHALNVYKKIGVPSEKCVPYTGLNGTCPNNLPCENYKIDGYKSLGSNEDKYPGMLYKYGPIAIGMIAASDEFYQYKGGVLDYPIDECGDGGHAVLLVGYTEDYWIAKNSWGSETWGEAGYFRFKRGTNFCNFTEIAAPVIPYLSKTAPTTQTP